MSNGDISVSLLASFAWAVLKRHKSEKFLLHRNKDQMFKGPLSNFPIILNGLCLAGHGWPPFLKEMMTMEVFMTNLLTYALRDLLDVYWMREARKCVFISLQTGTFVFD